MPIHSSQTKTLLKNWNILTGEEFIMSDEFTSEIEGKRVDVVQSIHHVGGYLHGFTIRFDDGSLLKIDAFPLHGPDAGIEVKFVSS